MKHCRFVVAFALILSVFATKPTSAEEGSKPAVAVGQWESVKVNCSQPLKAALADANFDWYDPLVGGRPGSYPPCQSEVKIAVMDLRAEQDQHELRDAMHKLDVCHATIPELLAYAKTHPDAQRTRSIAALGTIWQMTGGTAMTDESRTYTFSFITGDKKKRFLARQPLLNIPFETDMAFLVRTCPKR